MIIQFGSFTKELNDIFGAVRQQSGTEKSFRQYPFSN